MWYIMRSTVNMKNNLELLSLTLVKDLKLAKKSNYEKKRKSYENYKRKIGKGTW